MKGKDALGAWSSLMGGKVAAVLGKYKFVLLVILAGVVLMLLPSMGGGKGPDQTAEQARETFDTSEVEQRLETALSEVEGAGKVTVMLTVKSSARQILAQDSKTTQKESGKDSEISAVVISRGSGMQETVALQELSPQFQGALVVCAGGNDPAVRLKLVEAVSALTGLGSDKISICKGK